MPDEPAHEGLHLPEPSFTPIVLAAAISLILFGLVPDSRLWRLALISIGLVIAVIAGMQWIRDARRDFERL
jgi:hypothetical protein